MTVRGRQITVTQGGTTTTRTYHDNGQLLSESYAGGTLDGLSVVQTLDALQRRASVALNSQPATLNTFGYDSASRLASVSDNSGDSASYINGSVLMIG